MNILVFGQGWLGTKLTNYLGADKTEARITDRHQIGAAFLHFEPDVVINAAGIGGAPRGENGPKNIDWCVLSKTNRQRTWQTNVDGAGLLAQTCIDRGIKLVHLSSGCIFDGESPQAGGWTEEDAPCPVSYYSETKVEGERAILSTGVDALLIRPRLPMDSEPHPRNTITKLASYPNVMDVENSVSVVCSLLRAVRSLLEVDVSGIFHVTNPNPLRNADLMTWYREIVDDGHVFELKASEWFYEQGLCVERRSNCVLNTTKLMRAGVSMENTAKKIREALHGYAKALSEGA